MSAPDSASPLRRFLDLHAGEKRLLFEAWWSLLAAATRLRFAPRRTVGQALAGPPPPEDGAQQSAGTSQGTSKAATSQAIALAVSRAAAHHLWVMTCMPRAIALQRMLARHGIPAALRIGVRKEPPESGGSTTLAAHAWVEVEGQALGEPEAIAERFLPLVAVAERPDSSLDSRSPD